MQNKNAHFSSKPPTAKKKILFGSILLILSFSVLEFASYCGFRFLAMRFRQQTSSYCLPIFQNKSVTGRPINSEIPFKSGPATIAYKTNNLGFRDQEWIKSDTTVPYRIGIYGDSFTEGWGVEQNQRFSNLLESILQNKISISAGSVYNFGLSHSGPRFAANLHKAIGASLGLETAVFVTHTGNDFKDAVRENQNFEDRNPLNNQISVLNSLMNWPYSINLLKTLYLIKYTWIAALRHLRFPNNY